METVGGGVVVVGGADVVFDEPPTAVFCTDEVTELVTVVEGVVGDAAVPWFAAAACTLTATLPEIVCATPLLTTAASVGTTLAPPVPPVRPSSCAMSCASCPAGTAVAGEAAPAALI